MYSSVPVIAWSILLFEGDTTAPPTAETFRAWSVVALVLPQHIVAVNPDQDEHIAHDRKCTAASEGTVSAVEPSLMIVASAAAVGI